MAPLRVLVVTTAFPLSEHTRFTIAPWLWKILQEAQKHGVRIDILASAYRGQSHTSHPTFQVYRYRYAPARWETLSHEMAIYEAVKRYPWKWLLVPPFIAAGILQALRLSRNHRYDVVHVHWPLPFALQALPFRYAARLYTFHGSDLAFLFSSPLLRRLFGPLVRRAHAITVNSRFTRQRLEQVFPHLPPVEVLPMPPAMRIPPPETWPPRDPYRILFVGRFIELKGGEILLRAFQKVLQAEPRARLVMIGSGPKDAEWKHLARELGLEPAVTFTGRLRPEQLAREYPRAAVVAVPSYEIGTGQTEALGVVAIEALAFGTPVVASRTGGLPEVVLHEKTGLLVPPRDPEALAQALLRLLRNPRLRETLGRQGREHYKTHFSTESAGRRLAEIYRNLVSQRPFR